MPGHRRWLDSAQRLTDGSIRKSPQASAKIRPASSTQKKRPSFLVDRVDSSLRSRAVASIRRAIFSLHYKPGERLTEKGLRRLTGVSRSQTTMWNPTIERRRASP